MKEIYIWNWMRIENMNWDDNIIVNMRLCDMNIEACQIFNRSNVNNTEKLLQFSFKNFLN